ncbi:hypothetical protein PG996_014396 [Apiospora saccharicola]|uniref:BRCT domain-containing protein n=1 Tax=Apiospora saccharicola TaxID=335842 RepID=A0ABR1TIA9_9PEZI
MSLCAVPRPIFRGIVVATTGNVGQGRKDFTDADIQRYLQHWGGRFSADLDASVTHLVALPEEVNKPKQRPARVNSALKRKKLHIIKVDWLEDSFIQARKLPEKEYLLASGGRSIQESVKDKLEKEKQKAARDDEVGKVYPHPLGTGRFTPYMDATAFKYEVTLTRGEKGERYFLTLFESNAKPRTYHVGRIYSKGKGHKLILNRMDGPAAGVSFMSALTEFELFFARKTGIKWDDRVDVFHKGKGKLAGDGFVYELPTRGKPIGLVRGEVPDMDALLGPDNSIHEVSDHKDEAEAEMDLQENPDDPTEDAATHDGNVDNDNQDINSDDDSAMIDIEASVNAGLDTTITLPIMTAARVEAIASGKDEGVDTGNDAPAMGIGMKDEGYSSI